MGGLIPIHSDDAMFSKLDTLDSRLRGNDDTQLATGVHGAVSMKWYYRVSYERFLLSYVENWLLECASQLE